MHGDGHFALIVPSGVEIADRRPMPLKTTVITIARWHRLPAPPSPHRRPSALWPRRL